MVHSGAQATTVGAIQVGPEKLLGLIVERRNLDAVPHPLNVQTAGLSKVTLGEVTYADFNVAADPDTSSAFSNRPYNCRPFGQPSQTERSVFGVRCNLSNETDDSVDLEIYTYEKINDDETDLLADEIDFSHKNAELVARAGFCERHPDGYNCSEFASPLTKAFVAGAKKAIIISDDDLIKKMLYRNVDGFGKFAGSVDGCVGMDCRNLEMRGAQ